MLAPQATITPNTTLEAESTMEERLLSSVTTAGSMYYFSSSIVLENQPVADAPIQPRGWKVPTAAECAGKLAVGNCDPADISSYADGVAAQTRTAKFFGEVCELENCREVMTTGGMSHSISF
jgi:hypothetical protein